MFTTHWRKTRRLCQTMSEIRGSLGCHRETLCLVPKLSTSLVRRPTGFFRPWRDSWRMGGRPVPSDRIVGLVRLQVCRIREV
jgi:hypothetical protein